MRTKMTQMEAKVEQLLREKVIGPLSQDPMFQVDGSDHAEFDTSTIAEARIWNIVRSVAERGLSACQSRRRPQKALHVA